MTSERSRGEDKHTLLPFSIRTRSQTDTSAANLLNSRTLVSKSEVHLLIISSKDLPFSIEGGWTAMREDALEVFAVVVPDEK